MCLWKHESSAIKQYQKFCIHFEAFIFFCPHTPQKQNEKKNHRRRQQQK